MYIVTILCTIDHYYYFYYYRCRCCCCYIVGIYGFVGAKSLVGTINLMPSPYTIIMVFRVVCFFFHRCAEKLGARDCRPEYYRVVNFYFFISFVAFLYFYHNITVHCYSDRNVVVVLLHVHTNTIYNARGYRNGTCAQTYKS